MFDNEISYTFVVPVNDEIVYKDNFLSSPLLLKYPDIKILPQRGFSSASVAYNDAFEKAESDILIFSHQDVIFPELWKENLDNALNYLEDNQKNWGVIGCIGVSKKGDLRGYIYCNSYGGILGDNFVDPVEVNTLDEVVLILRKSSWLRFDEAMPNYHFYGTDICLEASKCGKKSYAISNFCLHNSNRLNIFPKEFIECYKYVKNKWTKYLPIKTTCVSIERLNIDIYKKYILQRYSLFKSRYTKKDANNGLRNVDPLKLLNSIKSV